MRRYELDINGKSFTITVREFSAGSAELEVDGTRYTVRVDDVVNEGPASPVRPTKSLATAGGGAVDAAGTGGSGARTGSGAGTGAVGAVAAPIPGQVLRILVAEGEEVAAGKPVLVMEAMKMENVINAPSGGTVGSILVNPGDAVTQGQELLVIV